jgi:hypothetical protein
VVPGRDSGGLGGAMTGSGRAGAFGGPLARLLDCTLGSNSCKAFRFVSLLAREIQQGAQLANNLSVELFFAKEESERFW